MPVHNVEIAQTLNKLADLLEIEGANAFRVRAYRNAARLVESLPRVDPQSRKDGPNRPGAGPRVGRDRGRPPRDLAGR